MMYPIQRMLAVLHLPPWNWKGGIPFAPHTFARSWPCTVLDIVGITPRYPEKRTNTVAWRAQARLRLFAHHILVVYRPWKGPNCIPAPETLTWRAMKEWLTELRKRDDIVSSTRLAHITIAAHCLRIPTASAKIVGSHQ